MARKRANMNTRYALLSSATFRSRIEKVIRPLGAALLAVVAPFALSGCADDTTYTYFAVEVSIDRASVDDDERRTIASCSLTVSGDDEDAAALPCAPNRVEYKLGTADYSTDKESGTLRFKVIMRNLKDEVVAEGESQPVAIVSNTNGTPIPVTVVAIGKPAATGG